MGEAIKVNDDSLDIIAREIEITALCRRYVEAGRPVDIGGELVDLVIKHTIEADYESVGCRFFSFACGQLGDRTSDFVSFINIFMEKARTASESADVSCVCMDSAGEVGKVIGNE